MERNDIAPGATIGFYGFMNQAIAPIGEAKSHLDICTALAERMDIKEFNDKTEEQWLKNMAQGSPDIEDYDVFKKTGACKIKRDEPFVAFQQEIEDPKKHPFPTPSGKIEIFSSQLDGMQDPQLPPLPTYIETWESLNDPLHAKYPLQLITSHFLLRAHSQYDNLPWLRELEKQRVWINSEDAKVRNIAEGDMVKVYNDRGVIEIIARVTERIMPGVVDVPQGAWHNPGKNGADRGGCANVLTRDQSSPGGAYPTNTALVQVERLLTDQETRQN